MGGLFPVAFLALHLGRLASAKCPSWQDMGNDTTCTCEKAWRVYAACLNCTTHPACQCNSSAGLFNLTDYYARECQGGTASASLYAAIIVPLVALLLVAVAAYFFVQRRQGTSLGRDKRASNASDTNHGQPRYISRAGAQGEPARDTSSHSEYENVFVGQPPGPRGGPSERRARKPSKTRPPPQVRDVDGRHGDQPIYANAQDTYYNYASSHPTEAHDEGVYVIPDH